MGIQSVMFVLQSLGLKGTVLCPEQIWKLLKSTKCHKVGRWHFESDSIGGQYWNWDAGVSGRGGLSRLCVCVFPACDDLELSLFCFFFYGLHWGMVLKGVTVEPATFNYVLFLQECSWCFHNAFNLLYWLYSMSASNVVLFVWKLRSSGLAWVVIFVNFYLWYLI